MSMNWRVLLVVFFLFAPVFTSAQQNVLSSRYDNSRTGSNTNETILNVSNVNVNQFGKLYSYPVDGAVLAQPLYVRGVVIGSKTYNVLIVATMNDKAYAFDADSNSPALWTRDFTNPPLVTYVPLSDIEPPTGGDLPNIGIQSTPVIDAVKGTIYLVARTKENGAWFQRLHALDITTGLDRAGSPVAITASVTGTAPDASTGNVLTFNPRMQNQRPGLSITNGQVVIAWASHDDILPYHGWVMSYDQNTLAQTGVLCVSPDYYYGGIWQSGRAPAIDPAGNVYFATANANWDGARNWGDSVLKLSVTSAGISILDWFTPSDWSFLFTSDTDLGSSGVMLIPNTNVAVAGGKESILYLLNSGNLGHTTVNDLQIVQKLGVGGGSFMAGPAFWNSASAGPLVFNWAETDVLRSYHFNGTTLDTGSFATGPNQSPGHPGGALSISANGNTSGTGIVWASIMTTTNADVGFVAGCLRAYNAETLQEIWDSEQNPTRDRLGTYMRFVPPTVVNGKVYAPTYDNSVMVYGLLSTTPDFSLAVAPGSQTITNTQKASYTVTVNALNGFTGAVTLSATGLPTGATATFTPPTVSGSGTSTLQITPGTGTPIGNSTIGISGTSGALTHGASAGLSITGNAGNMLDAQAFGDQASGATSVTTGAFSTAAGNELLVALVATDANSGANTTVTSVTGGGLAWSLVIRSNTQSGTSEIWRAFATAPLNGVAVTANLSSSVASSITVMSFQGVDTSGTNGSGAIGATAATNARTGAPTASVKTTRNSSLVIGVGNDFDNAISRTPGTGQFIVHQYLPPVGDTYWVQAQNAVTPLSGTTVTINDTAPTTDRYNLAIAEILPTLSVTPTYSITGAITPVASATGTTVSLSGAATLTATPDVNGNFTFAGLANGTYTVTPTNANYTFTPVSQSVTVSGANATAGTFTGQAVQTYTISGTIVPLANGTGVTVSLSGSKSASTTTDTSGNYTFNGLVNGTYTVTPAKTGFTFSPASQAATVNGANVGAVNFTAAAITYSISGTISPLANGTGVTVALSGAASGTTTTDASGNYTFNGLANGAYTVTPAKNGFTFSPASQPATVNGANVGAVNFTAAAITYSISGTISPLANGTGVTVSLSGSKSASTTTDASGNYTFSGLANGAYTVTPAKAGFTFSPASQAVTVNGANVGAVNFTANAIATYSISGTISPLANGVGVTVTLSGGSSASTTSDASGNYTFSGLANGSYTVTPSKSGLTFSPANAVITISNASAAGVNFTAQTVTTTAIATDVIVSTDKGTASTSIISPAFTTTSTNELLLAFVETDDTGSGTNTTVTGISGAGLTWSLVGRSNTQRGSSEIWRAFSAANLASVAVTATLSKSVAASMTIMTFTGASAAGTGGSGAVGAISSANAASGAPSATLVTTRNNSLVVGVGNDYDNAIARTPAAGQSIVHSYLAPVGDTYWVQRMSAITALSGTSVTLSDTAPTGDRYNLVICEILAGP